MLYLLQIRIHIPYQISFLKYLRQLTVIHTTDYLKNSVELWIFDSFMNFTKTILPHG